MMSNNYGISNTRDIEFVLGEWLPTEEVFNLDAFVEGFAKEDVPALLDAMRVFAKDYLEQAEDEADRFGVIFEDNKVHCCPTYKEMYDAMQEDGWGTSNFEVGGDGVVMPSILFAAEEEVMGSACLPIVSLLTLCGGVANLIQRFASDEVKDKVLPHLFSGEWTGSMCMTEAVAGSDIGSLQSKAKPTDTEGVFQIRGNKQFISFGDHDLTDNAIYAMLARVEGAAPGSKGLSLFVVPKCWIEDDGSLSDNDVIPVGIEGKMGLHGMPTVRMAFGQQGGCRGWLLGKDPRENDGRGDGISQMFTLMNFARINVGFFSVGQISNAVGNAVDYCKERVQGHPRVVPEGATPTLIYHEDVRRALMLGKAHEEAIRAMLYKTMFNYDISMHHPDEATRKAAAERVDFAVPLCKAYPAETEWDVIAEQLQLFGGYGYCDEFPMLKFACDCKVNSIWEGTDYIQSEDLVRRKFFINDSALFNRFISELSAFIDEVPASDVFVDEVRILNEARNALCTIHGYLEDWDVRLALVYAKRVLMATAQLYASWCILDEAFLANSCLENLTSADSDYEYYKGKIASMKYYLHNVTPEVAHLANMMSTPDDTALTIDVESFDF